MAKSLVPADIRDTLRPDRPLLPWQPGERRTTRLQDDAKAAAEAGGVSIEADPFNVLVLNYTMKCSLACDFCCYGCTPKRRETMALPFALDLVDQAADLGVFRQGGFTGGEPLLFLDEIKAIAARMHRHGMRFSMISACDWALDEAATERVIAPLADLGMDSMSISYDPSHAAWVPQDNVRRVAAACLKRGIGTIVAASFYSAGETLQALFPDLAADPRIELVNRLVLPSGNARRRGLSPEGYGIEAPHEDYACYKRIYHDLTVFWDGEAYPCCSVFNRATPGLSLGNLYDEPLAAIWDRLEGSLLFRWMKRQGFAAIHELLRERAPELAAKLPPAAEALGPCDLCHRIFRDRDLATGIRNAFDAEERARIRALLRRLDEGQDRDGLRRLIADIGTPHHRATEKEYVHEHP